jgi:hypothetical protein
MGLVQCIGMATATETRRSVQPRFTFAADLDLSQRQLAMLCDLEQWRFVSTAQFQRLYGQRAVRDTQFLKARGYIEHPDAQWVWRRVKGGGSRPRIHSLANPGAALLRELKLTTRRERPAGPVWRSSRGGGYAAPAA